MISQALTFEEGTKATAHDFVEAYRAASALANLRAMRGKGQLSAEDISMPDGQDEYMLGVAITHISKEGWRPLEMAVVIAHAIGKFDDLRFQKALLESKLVKELSPIQERLLAMGGNMTSYRDIRPDANSYINFAERLAAHYEGDRPMVRK